ncbi:MAG: SDR family oxidoreductase [Chlorobi bacterium]|nr:MAG: short-chain alcohol dehydrogenase [Chlorobi bacterium OLB7]MBK8912328.1 SDR family oxidoreductase [Chlorobiota bacterium]
MTSLSGSIAFITGATSGIGLACAQQLAKHGARLIVAARREERLQELAAQLRDAGTDVLPLRLDVRNQPAVQQAVDTLPEEWQAIDLLVNNAGLSRGLDTIQEGSLHDWEEMIDTNVKGLLYVSRAVLPGMILRGKGHVINIGSVAGHEVYPKGNVYCATKHAVAAITAGMRLDLLGTGVRVTTVDPGLVETEFSVVRFHGDQERAAAVYHGLTPLTPDDVADAVVYCATRPAHVAVAEMLLFPTAQASATQVSRRG